jgi:hypothetical protein
VSRLTVQVLALCALVLSASAALAGKLEIAPYREPLKRPAKAAAAQAIGIISDAHIERNTWEGNVVVRNMDVYERFLYANGLCLGAQCASMAPYLMLQVTTGMVRHQNSMSMVSIQAFQQSSQTYRLDVLAELVDATKTGIMINFTRANDGSSSVYPLVMGSPAPVISGNGSGPSLTIAGQYEDNSRKIMYVELTYQGVLMAAGRIMTADAR